MTDLLERIERASDWPCFSRDDDGWFVSTATQEPWGPYPTLANAIKAFLDNGWNE